MAPPWRELQYHNQVLVFHQAENDYIQRVKFPGETLELNSANCLDGVVLFASLLTMCDLDPAILLMRGHALVGWNTRNKRPAEWEFLDTTVISTHTFQQACATGREKYEQVQRLCETGAGGHFIFDPEKFAVIIDVHQILRRRKILPLSII